MKRARTIPEVIDRFRYEFVFLSNFYHCEITWHGFHPATSQQFASAEHAYQASKAQHVSEYDCVVNAPSASIAKKRGRKVTLKADFMQNRLQIMSSILLAKFSCAELAYKLCATEDAELIEGNDWGDTFWGVSHGVGTNHLGKLLMEHRTRLKLWQRQGVNR